MNFKKLALATAIAAVPVAGFSLEAIEDEALSEVSGQDGVRVVLGTGATGITGSIYLHDQDGLGTAGAAALSASYSYDGAIVISGFSLAAGAATAALATINIDAGDNAAANSAPILNVSIELPSTGVTIVTGVLYVANSQRDETNSLFGVGALSATILSAMTIVIGSAKLNIQLGNEAQTGTATGADMMVLSGSVTSGINIANFRLNDSTTGGDGGIMALNINIHNDNATSTLTLGADINVTDAGLEIALDGMGNAGAMTVDIENFNLGTSTNGLVGDISIVGLDVTGAKLTISGK